MERQTCSDRAGLPLPASIQNLPRASIVLHDLNSQQNMGLEQHPTKYPEDSTTIPENVSYEDLWRLLDECRNSPRPNGEPNSQDSAREIIRQTRTVRQPSGRSFMQKSEASNRVVPSNNLPQSESQEFPSFQASLQQATVASSSKRLYAPRELPSSPQHLLQAMEDRMRRM